MRSIENLKKNPLILALKKPGRYIKELPFQVVPCANRSRGHRKEPLFSRPFQSERKGFQFDLILLYSLWFRSITHHMEFL